jgi:hypothetical protein
MNFADNPSIRRISEDPGDREEGLAMGETMSRLKEGSLKFGLIGDGKIAGRHRQAIRHIGGQIVKIYDPKYNGIGSRPPETVPTLDRSFFEDVDWIVVASPASSHYGQVKAALAHGKKVICEKPYVLPWQPLIDSDSVFIVLQLRWLDLPATAKKIQVVAARNDDYFAGPKGNPALTGGLFFELFIHYIDLARRYGCLFEGRVMEKGEESRWIDGFNLLSQDMDEAYQRMYEDIVFKGKGVTPREFAELHWLLAKYTGRYGAGKEVLKRFVRLRPNGLV